LKFADITEQNGNMDSVDLQIFVDLSYGRAENRTIMTKQKG